MVKVVENIFAGAGSGMGREACRLMASQGATVVVTDINEKAAQETLSGLSGKTHISLKLDVTKKEEVESAISKIKAKYSSPPNIAVNFAGLMLWEPLEKLTEETYNRVFDVNVKGTVWVTQVVCRELVSANKKGSIINIASIAKDGYAKFSVYGATKAAVESFSNSVAREYGPQGIRVNTISPGYVDTPMMTVFDESSNNVYIQLHPMKRFAQPQEIVEAVMFLASDKASYVNAASLRVHGGIR